MGRKRRLVLSALAAVGVIVAGAAPAGAIVNGTPAKRSQYPFFAVIGSGCGGALVTPSRVLTAAHCTEALLHTDRVSVGPRGELRRVRLRAMLPLHVRELAKMEREFPPPAGDLMLLQLNRPVRDVPFARIATATEGLTAAGTTVTTIGRGASASDGSGQGVFRSGAVTLQPPSSCAEELGTQLLRRWSLCARDQRQLDRADPGPFVSACVGDSGSPLLAGPATEPRVIGVVSWGPSCGEQRDPEIYANAVAGRAFALARNPAWAPQAAGSPRVVGTPRVGRTVRCAVRWRVRPTRRLVYSFYLDRIQVQSGPGPTRRLRASDRGGRVSCDAQGETAGGRGGTETLAPPRLVR
ncbi:MAG: trypsin-like serine protease [Actinobacteria bacterium]|nr:trypsin-like serine protease [Actinomycetota bacterium]